MSLLAPKELEEQIIALLQEGELTTHVLLAKLQGSNKKPTKQGFYAALRKLKAQDAVVVYKKVAALNMTWVKQMREMFDRINGAYGGVDAPDILRLNDKESVSYSFATLQQLDNFWGHAQNIVVQATSAHEPVYTYDPHYWFLVARPDIERGHMDGINALGKQFLMTVAGKAPLDKALLPEFNTELRQYHMEKLFDRERYYVVVVGDYIFESVFSEDIERHIDGIYARHEEPNEAAHREFVSILTARARTKLKISRNRTRAKKLKAKLGKNFYIRKLAGE